MPLNKAPNSSLYDSRICQAPGNILTFPIGELGEDTFEEGFGFDASSIRGWAAIHESDMLLVPDATRYWMDPFAEQPTLCLIGNAVDPITKEGYAFDPRSVAVRAESYLKFTGSLILPTLDPRLSFSSLTPVNLITSPTPPDTQLTRRRPIGIAVAMPMNLPDRISVTAFARRKVMYRFHLPTH